MADPSAVNLRKKLHILRNRAPQEYRDVQDALNAWAGGKLALVTGLAANQLEGFQGQMQAIEQVLTFLKDAETKPID
jgi:hypothetical protein